MTNRQTVVDPLYTFKLVKGKGKRERIKVLKPCSSYTIGRQWDDEAEADEDKGESGEGVDGVGAQIGWELMLTRRSPDVGETVYLPQDAHTVYVENLNGKTVQTFRWPEKVKKQEHVTFRVMDDQDRQETDNS